MLSRHLRPCAAAESTDPSARPESEPPTTLDVAALARLTELDPTGKNHLLERVLQAFRASVARLRPQLDVARRDGDMATIRLVTHTLKSSSASIGALRLAQLCAQIETSIRGGTEADLGAPLDALGGALDTALDGALRAIDAMLKEPT